MPQYFGKMPSLDQTWTTPAAVRSLSQNQQSLIFDCGNSRLQVTVLAANLLRVRLTPMADWLPRRSWAVTLPDADWPAVDFQVQETETTVEIVTQQLQLRVDRHPCRLGCFDRAGRPLAQDGGLGMAWRDPMGAAAVVAWKQIQPGEHFYGFGERTRLLDKLAERQTNWTVDALDYDSLTDEMYQAIPFFMVLRPQVGYGIFLNTTCWSQFDLGAEQPGLWRMESHSCELDYYLVYGPTPAELLHTYTQLTGRMPLPPRWSLGYHQCRWSYDSEAVVQELAVEFRRRQIPCDVIHLDIDYMRGYRVFTWSPQRFPQPAKLMHDLAAEGFKVVTIVDPGVKYEPEADYEVFDQGLTEDYFVRKTDGALFHGYVWPDKAVFPDFMRAAVRQWWGDLQRRLTDVGVAGIWNDMNEPAIADRPFGDGGQHIWFPLDTPQGEAQERTTHAETHNLYGQMMAQASYEGWRRLRPQVRPFVLTRSGYAGIQRWSSVWMGDNQALWEHLELSLPMLCNMGLSGVGFVGCDIGGFAGNASAELYVRWMQVGMLYPLMRVHSALSTQQHEPWVYGDRVEQICRDYIELRYRLLPYLYTLFWEAATTGAPILRPLLYHFPDDPHTYSLYDQVFLGPSLMAAPVYRPGVNHRAVYLPEGTWYDWWSGQRFVGPTHILAHAPLERLPLYVQAGAVIPLAPVMQYVDQQPLTELQLRVWPGTGAWTLYEDDGQTFDYQTGAWATTTYGVTTAGETTTLDIQARQGNWTPTPRTLVVELVGGEEQRFLDDGTARSLTLTSQP